MKSKKILFAALAATCVLPFALAACGSDGGDGGGTEGGSNQTYVLEAEYVNLTGVQGAGISNSASGLDLLAQSAKASNGYYIWQTYNDGCTLTFDFNAEREGTAQLSIAWCSPNGDVTVTRQIFGFILNGTEIAYTAKQLKGAPDSAPDFKEAVISADVPVRQGANKLELVVHENTLGPASNPTLGPVIDYIKLTTKAGISWTPVTSNLDKFSGGVDF